MPYDGGGWAEGFAEGIRPKEHLTLSQWAEDKLVLPSERSASPGPYRIGDAAYQRGMMDAITRPGPQTVVYMTSAQVGKSTVLAAVEGYFSEWEPSPQLSVFPTQEVANDYVTESFDPMMKGSPDLAVLFDKRAGARGKLTGDHKAYPGGYVAFVGANNPRDLAARPIRVVKCDEVDRFPISSGQEGSPIDLAFKRTRTFYNSKKILSSTPLKKATSQIYAWYLRGDQRKFHVVCPDCNTQQPLVWEKVVFEKGKEHEAVYCCNECGSLWDELTKRKLVRDAERMGGGWIATALSAENIISFHLSELYSPWSSLADMAARWTAAEGNPEHEQTFYNTALGLPYEGEISSFADVEQLKSRREKYNPLRLPEGAGFITAGVDVQDDRIEVLPVAWGIEDESWLLNPIVVRGDPSIPAVWRELKEALERKYLAKSGLSLGIDAAAIDSGGHFTQHVYEFAHQHRTRRWYAIKGVGGEKKPIWEKSKARLKDGRSLFLVGVDDAKRTIYKRYGILSPGPGYIHLHEGISEDQLMQLSAEHASVEYDKQGFPKTKWMKDRSRRNEMLDMFVYAYAARCSWQGLDIAARLERLSGKAKPDGPDAYKIGTLYK